MQRRVRDGATEKKTSRLREEGKKREGFKSFFLFSFIDEGGKFSMYISIHCIIVPSLF